MPALQGKFGPTLEHLHAGAQADFAVPALQGDTNITYDLILDKFRSIEKPIDKYLTLRDLLRLAPKVYYDLLLKHTEEILPYIYTASSSAVAYGLRF